MKTNKCRSCHEKWLYEVAEKGEGALEKRITRKELMESEALIECRIDEVHELAVMGIVLGILDMVAIIVVALMI